MKTLLAVGLSAIAVLIPALATAQWTPAPETAVTIVDAPGTQQGSASLPDGSDGMFIVWEDTRNGAPDLYAQRIDASGFAQWTTNGVPVCIAPMFQSGCTVDHDGSGGLVIGWLDDRDSWDRVYAQRLDANGNALWTLNGVEIANPGTGTSFLNMVGDGAGGAYLAWAIAGVVWAQRVDASGAPVWASPAIVCDAPNSKSEVLGQPHPAGGVVFSWVDGRFLGNPKLYAQHLLPDGSTGWTTDGVALAVDGRDQRSVSVVSDGAGGFIYVWQDYVNAPTEGINLYAQRLLPTGAIAWGTGGQAICRAPSTQTRPRMTATPDGGAVITWGDWRAGGSPTEQVYAQRINSNGDPLWTLDGVQIAPAPTPQFLPVIAGDGAGGAHIFWQEANDLYARSIDAAGTPLGTDRELFIAFPGGDYTEGAISTSDGGAIAVVAPNNLSLRCDKLGGMTTTAPQFIRGDANDDSVVDISDAQFLLGFLFVAASPAPSCLAAADVNAGGTVDVSDVIATLDFLFSAGNPPAAPYPACGLDLSTPLSCDAYSTCP